MCSLLSHSVSELRSAGSAGMKSLCMMHDGLKLTLRVDMATSAFFFVLFPPPSLPPSSPLRVDVHSFVQPPSG